jgi:hypothetical protein
MEHIPLEKVVAIAMDYIANDPEVQEFVVYLQSDEFHKIVLTVEAVPEYGEVSISVHVFLGVSVFIHSPNLYLTKNIFPSLLTGDCIAVCRLLNSSLTVVLMLQLS